MAYYKHHIEDDYCNLRPFTSIQNLKQVVRSENHTPRPSARQVDEFCGQNLTQFSEITLYNPLSLYARGMMPGMIPEGQVRLNLTPFSPHIPPGFDSIGVGLLSP